MNLVLLESILNKKIKEMPRIMDESTYSLSERVKLVWSLFFVEIEKLDVNNSIWAGFREKDLSIHLREIEAFDQCQFFHEQLKTDSNCYVGKFKHDSLTNSFYKVSDVCFFIDSWYGSMSGQLNPFQLSNNSFYANKKAS